MARPIIPIPGLTEDEVRKLPRQERYKLRRLAAGLCSACGKRPKSQVHTSVCEVCGAKHRERMRVLTGAVRRHTGSRSYLAAEIAAKGAAAARRKRKARRKPGAKDTRREGEA